MKSASLRSSRVPSLNGRPPRTQSNDPLHRYSTIKTDLQASVNSLVNFKSQLLNGSQQVGGAIDQQKRSRMRIQIETLLIDLNEELFSLSDELARLYSNTTRLEN